MACTMRTYVLIGCKLIMPDLGTVTARPQVNSLNDNLVAPNDYVGRLYNLMTAA